MQNITIAKVEKIILIKILTIYLSFNFQPDGRQKQKGDIGKSAPF
jgi:hypothetical protein